MFLEIVNFKQDLQNYHFPVIQSQNCPGKHIIKPFLAIPFKDTTRADKKIVKQFVPFNCCWRFRANIINNSVYLYLINNFTYRGQKIIG